VSVPLPHSLTCIGASLEIKKDGAVIGDIQAARISIEDGAIFKGCIEIGRSGPKQVVKPESLRFW
jgi:cytoskeletal protein CcmA (bactofilin family)